MTREYHLFCEACDQLYRDADFDDAPERCPECGDELEDFANEPTGWDGLFAALDAWKEGRLK